MTNFSKKKTFESKKDPHTKAAAAPAILMLTTNVATDSIKKLLTELCSLSHLVGS
jgi:hypothetical protein